GSGISGLQFGVITITTASSTSLWHVLAVAQRAPRATPIFFGIITAMEHSPTRQPIKASSLRTAALRLTEQRHGPITTMMVFLISSCRMDAGQRAEQMGPR